ncbi:MAG: hypothetical protein WBG47_15500 [Gordonia sp. (in: high G+C Gram-positive bacteria)]|uniref:hypothetical protein n=1 Tax=Gordonia sp. (in: high G+C Gram-positive bacteria) TaxID=84139 RepID=UPI003C737707
MSELRYLREVWLKRAEVAKECAGELRGLRNRLEATVTRNYFGAGCIEGAAMFIGLQALIKEGAEELGAARDSAQHLSATSELAATAIESADADSSR